MSNPLHNIADAIHNAGNKTEKSDRKIDIISIFVGIGEILTSLLGLKEYLQHWRVKYQNEPAGSGHGTAASGHIELEHKEMPERHSHLPLWFSRAFARFTLKGKQSRQVNELISKLDPEGCSLKATTMRAVLKRLGKNQLAHFKLSVAQAIEDGKGGYVLELLHQIVDEPDFGQQVEIMAEQDWILSSEDDYLMPKSKRHFEKLQEWLTLSVPAVADQMQDQVFGRMADSPVASLILLVAIAFVLAAPLWHSIIWGSIQALVALIAIVLFGLFALAKQGRPYNIGGQVVRAGLTTEIIRLEGHVRRRIKLLLVTVLFLNIYLVLISKLLVSYQGYDGAWQVLLYGIVYVVMSTCLIWLITPVELAVIASAFEPLRHFGITILKFWVWLEALALLIAAYHAFVPTWTSKTLYLAAWIGLLMALAGLCLGESQRWMRNAGWIIFRVATVLLFFIYLCGAIISLLNSNFWEKLTWQQVLAFVLACVAIWAAPKVLRYFSELSAGHTAHGHSSHSGQTSHGHGHGHGNTFKKTAWAIVLVIVCLVVINDQMPGLLSSAFYKAELDAKRTPDKVMALQGYNSHCRLSRTQMAADCGYWVTKGQNITLLNQGSQPIDAYVGDGGQRYPLPAKSTYRIASDQTGSLIITRSNPEVLDQIDVYIGKASN